MSVNVKMRSVKSFLGPGMDEIQWPTFVLPSLFVFCFVFFFFCHHHYFAPLKVINSHCDMGDTFYGGVLRAGFRVALRGY